jgi:AbrB family looped-hinge helix DNA binding protein
MVEFTTIVGSKGQVVIPKPLSEEHGLILGKRVVIKETEGKITLERPN